MQVPTQHGAYVAAEAQSVQHGQETEQGRVGGLAEPRLDWNRVIWKRIII